MSLAFSEDGRGWAPVQRSMRIGALVGQSTLMSSWNHYCSTLRRASVDGRDAGFGEAEHVSMVVSQWIAEANQV